MLSWSVHLVPSVRAVQPGSQAAVIRWTHWMRRRYLAQPILSDHSSGSIIVSLGTFMSIVREMFLVV